MACPLSPVRRTLPQYQQFPHAIRSTLYAARVACGLSAVPGPPYPAPVPAVPARYPLHAIRCSRGPWPVPYPLSPVPCPLSAVPSPLYPAKVSFLVNADDFGLTPGVNRSVAELHQAHALSSATLMATGAFFDDAVATAIANPTLEVGCHVLLVDGTPVLPPEQIPSLVCTNGKFRPTLTHFVRDLFTYRINREEIIAEATAQIRRLQDAGLRVSHIDTHKHTHLFSGILRPLLRAAQVCRIPAIRNPFEPAWALRATTGVSALRRMAVVALGTERRAFHRLVRASGLRTPAGTIGVLATGTTGPENVAATLRAILAAQPNGPASTWELVCHPGYPDAALDQVRTRLRASRGHEHQALLQLLPGLPLAAWRDLTPSNQPS